MFPKYQTRRVVRRIAVPVVSAVAALGLSVSVAAPASASGSYSGRAYVWGTDGMADDWDDEGVVNVATHRSSNVTCLWQTILAAHGYLPTSGIDGVFGDQTDAATRDFQRDHGLGADGSVGRNTFAKAGNNIVSQDISDGWRWGFYDASRGSRSRYSGFDFAIRRSQSSGNYQFWETRRDVWRTAGYNGRTCG